MKKYQSKLFIFALVIFAFSGVQAAEVTSTFADGDNLTATQMNEIKGAVNDNDTRINALQNSGGDTLTGLSCNTGQVAKFDGTSWICAEDVDTDTDTLASLNCVNGQVAQWNEAAQAWQCVTPTTGSSIKYISLNPYGAFFDSSASFLSDGFGANAGIHMPSTGTGSFTLGFTLPPDYVTGDPITISFVANSPSVSCDATLLSNAISVARVGINHIVGSSTADGLSPVGGPTITYPATPNQSVQKLYNIVPPDGITDLQAGDAITFNLFRSPASLSDTCTGDSIIQGIAIQY